MIIYQKKIKQQVFSLKKIGFFIFFSALLVALFILLSHYDYFIINVLKKKIIVLPEKHFYHESIEITLESPIKADIFYTIDGSNPEPNSYQYQDKIKVDKTTVLKFALFKNKKQIGQIQTHDFFINTNHNLPVLSISTDSKNLFDNQIGIYVVGDNRNFTKKGEDWERPAFLSFFESDQSLAFERNIGLRLHGGGSRGLPQKSFRIYIKDIDKNETLNYQLFPDSDVNQYNTFVLRNGGGDAVYSTIRDVLAHELIKQNSTLDISNYRPVVLYLNGEYWGLYHLRERQDQYYFQNKYNLDLDRLTILNIPHDVGDNRGLAILDYGKNDSDVTLYNDLFKKANRCDKCTDFNYYNRFLDIDNLIDYYIFEIFFANFDWPFGNMKAWKYQTAEYEPLAPLGQDGRFRWIVYDVDVGFGYGGKTLEDAADAAESGDYGRLIDDKFPFRFVFFNNESQIRYLNRFADLLNTTLSADNMIRTINEITAELEPEMPNHLNRWSNQYVKSDFYIDDGDDKGPASIEEWHQHIDFLKEYCTHRSYFMWENTREYFDLSGITTLTVETNDPKAGKIKVNSILLTDQQLPWSGQYFKNVPVQIKAIPNPGYEFSHWDGANSVLDTKKTLISLNFRREHTIKAYFKKK